MRPRGRARGQEQAEPDAEQRPQRGHDEDHRDPPCPVAARSDLADVRVDDRQVGTDADAGDHAGQDELRVAGANALYSEPKPVRSIVNSSMLAPADAVGDRGEEERADHVTRQVEDDRHAQRRHRYSHASTQHSSG
jgi:hypothetical protein